MNVSKAVMITAWATAERLVDVGWRVYATARSVEKIAPLE
jgi:NADP-dependent 3-hydroxy acid dehydrogenase YdfG